MCPQLSRALDDPRAALGPDRVPVRGPRSRHRAWRWSAAATVGALALLGAACSQDNPPSATGGGETDAPTTAGETTTTAPPPTWPLTGVVGDAAAMNIPAIVVKVDNNDQARPHAGINQADIVYELQVEGITRFMEVFHSDTPDRVGPVRSARSSDIDLFSNLRRPIFVWSGGNGGVTAAVHRAVAEGRITEVVDDGSRNGPRFFRDSERQRRGIDSEHTLFANLQEIRAQNTPPDAQPPTPIFPFRKAGQTLDGGPAAGVVVSFIHESSGNVVRAEYAWDAERSCWARFQVDGRHNRADSAFVDEGGGVQVCPQNVVVLFLQYGQDPIDSRSPKAESVGTGTGFLLSDGKAIAINWARPTPESAWVITDEVGNPVGLTPGKTWVELPKAGVDAADILDAAGAQQLLAVRK